MDNVIPKIERKKKLLKRKYKNAPYDDIGEICIESIHIKKIEEYADDLSKMLQYQLSVTHILFELEKVKNDPLQAERVKELTREYCKILGLPLVNYGAITIDSNHCPNCNTIEYIYEIACDGYMVCTNCGCVVNQILGENLTFSEKMEANFKPKIDYKKINYFVEWLSRIQGKGKTVIPDTLVDIVKEELSQQRIDTLTADNLRNILKYTNNSKYYEDIPVIMYKLNGLAPLGIPEPIEEIMKYMFYKVQCIWEIHKPKARKNFFSYPYILHKFCLILNLEEYLPYFPLLKSREKVIEQEIVFEDIITKIKETEDSYIYNINWRFIPSV